MNDLTEGKNDPLLTKRDFQGLAEIEWFANIDIRATRRAYGADIQGFASFRLMVLPVSGVRRPKALAGEGLTPRISNEQAKRLPEAPPTDTLKGKRDRAILATLLFHGLRLAELCSLRVQDFT